MDDTAPNDAGKNEYVDWVHSAVLLLVVISLWAFRLGGPIDLRWDAGVYYILGTSLYEGKGYRLLNEPGEIQAIQYPPLLPAIVAAHQWLAGDERPGVAGHLLRWTMAGITAAYVLTAYRVARWWLSPIAALAAALLVAVHPTTLFMSDVCFAEIPFGLACLGFLAINRAGGRWSHEVASGMIGTICFMLRSLGLAMLAAWVLEAAIRRRFGLAAFRATVAVIPVLAWQGYVFHVRSSPEYLRPAYAYQRAPYLMYNVSYAENVSLLDPFSPEKGPATLPKVAMRTLSHFSVLPAYLGAAVSTPERYLRRILDLAKLLIGGRLEQLALPTLFTLGGFVLIGVGVLVSRREWLVVLFVVTTSAMICISPWPDQFNRYLSPLAPLLMVSLFLGVSAVCGWLRRVGPYGNYVATFVTATIATGLLLCSAQTLYSMNKGNSGTAHYVDSRGLAQPYRLFYYGEEWSAFDAALAWLKQAAGPDDFVVTTAPHRAYLTTGLKAVQPPYEADPEEAQRLLDSVPATYLIVDSFDYSGGDLSRRYAVPAIRKHPDLWELAFESPGGRPVRVYRRLGKAQR
ncbi:MAG: hypothetical protein ABS79_00385 [Planctomycetes bacterium SCN 63-9]|nr:MAG: hypothetical protein ABS79_00385 [Planctomycetes bacterium SCN 63-9]